MTWYINKGSTYIELGLENFDGLDGARKSENLATTNLLTLDTTEQSTHVVTSFSLLNNDEHIMVS